MNQLDLDYLNLVRDILENGTQKKTRNGEVLSVFGRTIRHSMKDGFPLLTSKKMAWKTMVTELLFFLRGDTNIKYLVDNNCHIWDGDCYHAYLKKTNHEIELNNVMQTHPHYGLSQEEFINKIKTDDEFAKKWGELGPVYGKQWRQWGSEIGGNLVKGITGGWIKTDPMEIQIDQIANVIHLLKTDPDSRRMIVNAWNVGELDQMVLPPCHMMFQFYTRELSLTERNYSLGQGKAYKGIFGRSEKNDLEYKELFDKENRPTRAISLRWDQRSVDVGLGLPFNIASYALLLELVAKSVNMVPEEVIGDLGDCHIYNNHIDGLKEQLTRTPYELPSLNINTEFWPTESGECGVGPIDATAVFNSFTNDHFCKCLLEDDIQLYKYQSHPSIKLPLSN